MGGTLNEQCRVSEDGLRIVKLCCERKTTRIGNDPWVMVSRQKVTANYVPAAAVIRRWRALSGMIGRKGCVGGPLSLESKPAAQLSYALETGGLECRRGISGNKDRKSGN